VADALLPSSHPLTADAELPEALQAPTTPVKASFTAMLTIANAALYFCYIGVGSLPLTGIGFFETFSISL
jgi:hypothetical protein